jgi:hypothetical protein
VLRRGESKRKGFLQSGQCLVRLAICNQLLHCVGTNTDWFVCSFVVNSADAVYFPRAIEDPKVLEQEGWHYEVDEKGDLVYNGVV